MRIHGWMLGMSLLANAWSGSSPALAQGAVKFQVTQDATAVLAASAHPVAEHLAAASAPAALEEIVARVFARERETEDTIEKYQPIVETYIQRIKYTGDGELPALRDYLFLGQADFTKRLKVQPMIPHERKGSFFWSFDPAGFAQMIFLDRSEFDKEHYRLEYAGREFLGEVRCLTFDVSPLSKKGGARFLGRIWVEDRDDTIVRFNGRYAPGRRTNFRTMSEDYYLHFDSWRTNVRPGVWMPTYVYSQELGRKASDGVPHYKAQTRLWGYNLGAVSRENEFSKLVVESAQNVNDEAARHDRSPLEGMREWRREAERNVLDSLERTGLLAPQGEVEKTLNTVVNNLAVTNRIDGQIDLNCRVLLTSTLELFSIGNTIVLSRGLIDVIPDESTLGAIIAQGMAGALVPDPSQDMYAFSDMVRATPVTVVKRLSFEHDKVTNTRNSQKAAELFSASPYAKDKAQVGLFFAQLNSQAKVLKQLISARLGNAVFLEPQLLGSAPPLEPDNKVQITALPVSSRLKLDPMNDRVEFLKTVHSALLSPREKMPFEIAPLMPYLTRYEERTAAHAITVVPTVQNQ